MTDFLNAHFRTKRLIVYAALFAALVMVLAQPARSAVQAWPCSWPLEVTGMGLINAAYPDTDATYWLMPIDTATWKMAIVSGEYPKSRFFSFVTYLPDGSVIDSIEDDHVEPDLGSANPFVSGQSSEREHYTLVLSRDPPRSANDLRWEDANLIFVVYRVYVADRGLNREGGVSLPEVTLRNATGDAHRLQPCRVGESPEAKRSLTQSLDALALATTEIRAFAPIDLNNLGSGLGSSCQGDHSRQHAVVFLKNPRTNGGPFSNPANTYMTAGGLCPEPNQVVVIRGKAAVFPDTYNGNSVFQPAIPGDMQLRYWSMCNNNQKFPFSVVACQPDWATTLDEQGFFTYVMSPPESAPGPPAPPPWVPASATWLPWGDPAVPKILYFREMLPVNGFVLSGDFLPQGVYCDKDLFVSQGWQGCFAAAGEVVH